MERVKGIEPSYSAWKAAALPLSYTRAVTQIPALCGKGNRAEIWPFNLMVGEVGLEPTKP
jgi:hypothetical protein